MKRTQKCFDLIGLEQDHDEFSARDRELKRMRTDSDSSAMSSDYDSSDISEMSENFEKSTRLTSGGGIHHHRRNSSYSSIEDDDLLVTAPLKMQQQLQQPISLDTIEFSFVFEREDFSFVHDIHHRAGGSCSELSKMCRK